MELSRSIYACDKVAVGPFPKMEREEGKGRDMGAGLKKKTHKKPAAMI